MNRRELFASLFPAAAAVAVATSEVAANDHVADHVDSVDAVDAGGILCLVVTCDDDLMLTPEIAKRIKSGIGGMIGPKCPPIIVLAPGMSIQAIYKT